MAGDMILYIVLEENNGVMYQRLSSEHGHDASIEKFPVCRHCTATS
jgi:hypothetical protein